MTGMAGQQLSDNGAHFWDGVAWRQLDTTKRWYWTGSAWNPLPSEFIHGGPRVTGGSLPAELWLIILVIAAAGVAVLIPALNAIGQVVGNLSGPFVSLELFVLGILLLVAGIGVGLVWVAWLLGRGSPVGLGVAYVLLIAVAAQSVFASQGGATSTVALVLSLAALAVLALSPRIRRFYAAAGSPVAPAAAAALIAVLGACFGLLGLSVLPLGGSDGGLVAIGLALIAFAACSFSLAHKLRLGSPGARVLATIVMVAYLVLTLAQWQRLSAVVFPLVLAGGVVALLWLAPSSAQHFRTGTGSQPRPVGAGVLSDR